MFNSTHTKQIRKGGSVFLGLLIVLSLFTGGAAAQGVIGDDGEVSGDFICSGETADSNFVSTIRVLMGLFFVGSFVFAIMAYGLDKADSSAGSLLDLSGLVGGGTGTGDSGSGKKAAMSAALLPIGVLTISFAADLLFGIDVSCLIPII